MYNEHISC